MPSFVWDRAALWSVLFACALAAGGRAYLAFTSPASLEAYGSMVLAIAPPGAWGLVWAALAGLCAAGAWSWPIARVALALSCGLWVMWGALYILGWAITGTPEGAPGVSLAFVSMGLLIGNCLYFIERGR